MKFRVEYSPRLSEQLRGIKNQISFNSDRMGEIVVDRLFQKMRTLDENPQRGMNLANKVTFSLSKEVRFLLESGYYIFYVVEKEFVYVFSVVHARQDYMRMFDFLKK